MGQAVTMDRDPRPLARLRWAAAARTLAALALAAGLGLAAAGCSRDGAGGAGGAGGDAGPAATAGGGTGPAGSPAGSPAGGGAGAGGGGGGPGGGAGGTRDTSPIVDVRGTVASVDRAAGLIRLRAPDAGYSVIEVNPSTKYGRSEGEPAGLADVVPAAEVVGTGLGGDGRLRARLVTILTY